MDDTNRSNARWIASLFFMLALGMGSAGCFEEKSSDSPPPVQASKLPSTQLLGKDEYQVSSDWNKSEIKIVGGVPRFFINGEEIQSNAINVYYFPPQEENKGPAYGTHAWENNVNALIDRAVGNGTQLILLNVWWSDLDQSVYRPLNIGDNLDFRPLDAVFDHAWQKGAYIMPIFVLFPFDPDWWLEENNFPPFDDGKVSDFCETDSYGNVYPNASMNSDVAQRDFGAFVKAVVEHYKNNPALGGWIIGVGATGEDGYGPNYIIIKDPGNIRIRKKIEEKPMMYTDYSPYFTRNFRKWMEKKYKENSALQRAWGDNVATLSELTIPMPENMIKAGANAPRFPDPTDIFYIAQNGTDGSEALNTKGRDFYEFRNYMRREDRKFYVDLIKQTDPEHVLILNGVSDDLLGQGLQFDGIAFSMLFDVNEPNSKGRSFYFSTDIAKRAAESGKLAIISSEHTCDETHLKNHECETPDQLQFIESLGKAVKCMGQVFAPCVSVYSEMEYQAYIEAYLAGTGVWLPPVCFSENAMAVVKAVAEFQPDGLDACSIARELYQANNCSAGSGSGCEWFAKSRESLCKR